MTLALGAAAPAGAATYYISPTGTAADACTSGDPCDFATAHGKVDVTEIVVTPGTYTGGWELTKPVNLHGQDGQARPIVTADDPLGGTIYLTPDGAGATVRRLEVVARAVAAVAVGVYAEGYSTWDDLVLRAHGTSPGTVGEALAFISRTTATAAAFPVRLQNSTATINSNYVGAMTVDSSSGELEIRNVDVTRVDDSPHAAVAAHDYAGGANPAPTIDVDGLTIHTNGAACLTTEADAGGGNRFANVTAVMDPPGDTPTSGACVYAAAPTEIVNVDTSAPDSDGGALRIEGASVTASRVIAEARVGCRVGLGGTNFELRRSICRGTAGPGVSSFGPSGVLVSDTVGTGAGSWAGMEVLGGGSAKFLNVTAIGTDTGGIRADGGGTVATVKNSIARDAGIAPDLNATGGAVMTVSYSNFVDSTGTTAGAGNQSSDPLFANSALGDFHLLAGSPAIDAGAGDADLGGTDFEGDTRPTGAAPDIGADEYVPPPPPPPPGDGGGGGETTPPPADTPPPTIVPPVLTPVQIGGPVVTISASPVTVTKTGVANIRVGCPSTAAQFCQGTLTLRTATRVNVAARRILTLGRRTFKINAGARGVVGVKLTRQARRVLRRAKRLRIKAIANVRDGNGAARITQRLLSLKARR